MIEKIEYYSENQPNRTAFIHLLDGDNHTAEICYQQLRHRAVSLAHLLLTKTVPGQRAMILLPSCFDYICSFLACLYAGIIAVPGFVPHASRENHRLEGMLLDANPAVIIAHSQDQNKWLNLVGAKDCDILLVDQAIPERNDCPPKTTEAIAFLQYTSGSTSEPKGVMISHENLLANFKMIDQAYGLDDIHSAMTWLPFHHDMGLIGMILTRAFIGKSTFFMTPMQFFTRPIRWLKALSHYKVSLTGAPNFALEHCINRIDDQQLHDANINLQHLKLLFCGSEPIHPMTLKRFTHQLIPYGFDETSVVPTYGLAETTLWVSGFNNKREVYE